MGRRSRRDIDWRSAIPFLLVHAGCLLVAWTGLSATAIAVLFATYALRAFGVTAGYHRYFSHRSFVTGRAFQFVLAMLGCSAAQMGPLWWAGHHRLHHRSPDSEHDPHSPAVAGFWWAHAGWIFARENAATRAELVGDLARFPELVWLDRHHYAAPAVLIAGLYALGSALERSFPALHTSGAQLVVSGFFLSTTLVYHLTFAVNSFGHAYGTRRFATADCSRNSFVLALLTWGEGWHNNHHRYPRSERQGFARWEIDLTHYALCALARTGLVWGLVAPPAELTRASWRRDRAYAPAARDAVSSPDDGGGREESSRANSQPSPSV